MGKTEAVNEAVLDGDEEDWGIPLGFPLGFAANG